MPVRSWNSSVLKWPSAEEVDRAVRSWTAAQVEQRTDIVALGYFGSYARGDWGVGSDLDVIAVLKKADQPFERRSAGWDLNSLPVPAEILVYSRSALHKLMVPRERDVTAQTKAAKGLAQAAQLLGLLMDERRGDLSLAWEALARRGPGWVGRVRRALKGSSRDGEDILERAAAFLGL